MILDVPLNAINDEYLNWDLTDISNVLKESIQSFGCLVPIVCIKFNHEFYIIDGAQRFKIASELSIPTLPCVVIQPNHRIFDIISNIHHQKFFRSSLLRIRFINQFNIEISEKNAQIFQLPFYSHIKKDIQRLSELDLSIQKFFFLKGYSLKEMVHLIHFSIPLVYKVVHDDYLFSFSKRSFDQFIIQSSELIKRYSWTIDELFEKLDYHSICSMDITPQQRLKILSDNTNKLCNSTLIDLNKKISSIVDEFNLNYNTHIKYDSSLENVDVILSSKLSSFSDYESLIHKLKSSEAKVKFKQLMEFL